MVAFTGYYYFDQFYSHAYVEYKGDLNARKQTYFKRGSVLIVTS